MKDRALWARIEAADLGGLDVRLAETAGQGLAWAGAVTAEYRRFLYLAALVKTARRVPSPAVQRAWRLHAEDASGYAAFCAAVLMRPLPLPAPRTGRARAKDVAATRKAYAREFGAPPPADLWPDPDRWVYRIVAAAFAGGGIAGGIASGIFWPAIAGVAVAGLVLFAPRSGNSGMDDAAFIGIVGHDTGPD